MGKLFGTDGIRGVVGENLTAEMAFRVGQAVSSVLEEETGRRPVIIIGKDTRISSDMLESALMAGICSVGGDVKPVGSLPTPAVAYLARQEQQVAEFKKAESRLLPPDADYGAISGLRLEARQKLAAIRPLSVGQASRISGVSPADLAVLLIWLEQQEER